MKQLKHNLSLIGILLISITSFAQPANDDCAGAQSVTPDASCIGGSTVSANDTWTGGVGCQSGNPNLHPDVWYSFTATGSSFTNTTTAGAGWTGDIEYVLAEGSCATIFTILTSSCGASPLTVTYNGLTPGVTYYFTVSNSASGATGAFQTCTETIAPPASCTDNDLCVFPDVQALTTSVQTCITDCNIGGTPGPDFAGSVCEDFPTSTVWYEFTSGASDASIDVSLTSGDLNDPHYAIFASPDCATYTFVDCIQGSGGSASATSIINSNTTYLIAVSDGNGAEGNFDLCMTLNPDNSACNTNKEISVSATSMGSPLSGPYQPGEIVTFCYTITDWTQFNCNYLGGIVPTFGDCWDPVSFDGQGMPVNITTPLVTATTIQPCGPGPPCPWGGCAGQSTGDWIWFDAGVVNYNNLGGAGSLPDGTPLAAGWYFLTNYDPLSGACNPDPTDPNLSYGDGAFPNCGTNNLDWQVCFQLQAQGVIACTNGQIDCSVSVATYADGEIGIWNNIGCTADGPIVFNAGLSCCPTITNPGDQTECGSYTLPVIAGILLSGTEMYYTGPGGTGTSFAAGAVISSSISPLYIYDDNGDCSDEEAFNIAINVIPTAALSGGGFICAGDPIPDMTVTLTGIAPWSITYTDGLAPVTVPGILTSPYTISVAPDGAYSLTAVSDANCTGTFSGSSTITTIPLPTAILVGGGTICEGDAIPDMTITLTGASPWSITYTDGVAPVTVPGILTSPYVISGAADGSYDLSAVSDGNCAGTFSGSADIITNLLPSAILSGGGTYCFGTSVPDMTVTLTGSAPWSIAYTDGVTPVTVTGILTSPYTISGAANGSYTLSAVSDANCIGTFSGNASITVISLPAAAITGGGTICEGDVIPDMPVTLTGTSPWSITYTDGVTSVTVPGILTSPYTISGAADGTYVISAVSDADCSGNFSGSATITTTPLPLAPITSADVAYCDGDALADITASGSGGTLTWYSDAGLTNIIGTGGATTPASTIGTTTYYVAETTTGGCEGPAGSVAVTVNALPIIDSEIPTDATTCGGADGTITITASGGSGSYSYSIDGGITFTNTTGIFTGLAVNSYQIVIDDGNCQVTGSILSISAPSTPIAPVAGTNAIYCEGDAIADLTAVTSLGGTLTWYDDAGLINVVGTGGTFSPPTTAGSYTYYVTEIAAGCEGPSSQITIDINSVPTAIVTGGGIICFGDPIPDVVITLTGSSPWSITYTDGLTPVTVSPGTSPFTLSNSSDGSYEVTAVSDVTGCMGTFSGVVNVITNPDLTGTVSGGGTICFGDPIPDVTLTLAGSSPWDLTYTDGVTPVTINTTTSPFLISGGLDGTYTITSLTDASGCPSAITGSAVILTNTLPVAIVSGGGTICATDPIPDVTITLTGNGPWDITYEVDGDPNNITVVASPYVISGGIDGNYVVTLVSDINCIGTSNGSANVVTNPLPTAIISGGGVICSGLPIPDISIALTGTGPWNVTYFDGSAPTTISTNSNPYVISNGIDGTYTVTNISDVNCVGIASGVANLSTNPLPTSVVSGGGTICIGDPIPDVVINLTGTSPWTLTYTDGVTPVTVVVNSSPFILSNATDGVYSVTSLTDATSCIGVSITGLAEIITNVLPTASLSGGGTICAGDVIPDITIDLTGNGPWDFTFTEGINATPVTAITSPYVIANGVDGTYSITSVNDMNCIGTSSGSGTILSNPLPLAPDAGIDAIYCIGDPIIDLFAAGGGGFLTWYTDMGITLEGTGTAFSPINSVGSFTYYISEELNGCTGPFAQVNVDINDVPTIDSEIAVDVSGCNVTDGSITILASGGLPPYSYSIDGGITFTNTTGIFTGLDVNSYQVIVADVNCQTVGSLLVVTGPGIPAAPLAGTDTTYCEGASIIDLTAAIGAGGSLSWYDDAGLTNLVGNNATFTPSNTIGTLVYYVTETVTNCESPSAQITVTINPTPMAPIPTGADTYCDGDPIANLVANPAIGGNMIWYDDAGLTNIIFIGQVFTPVNAVGTYSYYVLEALNGCYGPAVQVDVIIRPTPVFSVSSTDPTICSGVDGTLLITGLTPGNSYDVSYSENGVAVPSVNIVADANGEILVSGLTSATYSLVTLVLNGCSATDLNVFILTDPLLPVFTIFANSPTSCGGIDGSLVLSGLDLNTTYNIDYLEGGVLVSVSLTSDGAGEIVIESLGAGLYSDVAVTLSGCTATLAGPYNLMDPNSPAFSIGSTINPSGCGIADASITINGLLPNTTYNLTYDVNGLTVGPASITTDANGIYIISGIQGGTYEAITIELSSCISSDLGVFILAPIYPTAPIAFTDSAYCEGAAISDLNGISAFGGTMTWYSDASLTIQVGAGPAYTVLDITPGTYTYYVTETLSNCEGPSSAVTVIITATPAQPGISVDVAYCDGDSITDLVASPVSGGQIIWYSDALLIDSIGSGIAYTPAPELGTVTYYVTETVGNCVSSASSSIVVINPNPIAGFDPTPGSGNVPLDVYFDNTSLGGNTYAWDLGDGTTSTSYDPSNLFTETGEYNITLTIVDANDCTDSTSAVIIVEGTSTLIIPNIFTPNGDGNNDVFNLSGTNITDIKGTIMNRWGQVVYQFNTLEAGWAGRTVSGLEAAEGTYFYFIDAVGADGETYNHQGPFQLIR